jgi:phosphoglycolate phosphatase
MGRANKKVKTLVFDMDGTIADSLWVGLECANKLAEKYKYDPIEFSPVIRDLSFKEFLRTHLKLGKIKLIFWARELKRLINQNNDTVKIFPGIKELLSRLKEEKYHIGILTSNSTKNVLKTLKNNQIETYFDFMYTNSLPFGKWISLYRMLRRERLKKNETLYIGDEIRDIDSCNIVGLSSIAVTWGANSPDLLREANANFYADSPEDILNILHSLED